MYRRGPDGRPDRPLPVATDIVTLKNSSGGAVRRYEVLQIRNEFALTTVTREHIWLVGETPTAPGSPFGVALEPINATELRPAQVSGVCPALINIVNATDTYADLEAGSKVLQSTSSATSTRILYKPSGTGEKLCVVLLSGGAGGGGGAEIISFRVLAAGPFYSEIDVFCLRMRCEVVAVSCQGATVSVGDEIDVWDPQGTFFSVPIDILLNMLGTASKMAWDPEVGIPGDCFREYTPEEIAALPYAGQCWWNVVNMSCVEEWYDSSY